MAWTLALDLLMSLLLTASIVATVVLNRKLNSLRATRGELELLAESFRASTSRADEGVAGLKVKAQTLQERIDAARTLTDDLEFLIERGTGLADRLESDVRAARRGDARPKAAAAATTAAAAVAPVAGFAAGAKATSAGAGTRARQTDERRSAAERHLMAALRVRT